MTTAMGLIFSITGLLMFISGMGFTFVPIRRQNRRGEDSEFDMLPIARKKYLFSVITFAVMGLVMMGIGIIGLIS